MSLLLQNALNPMHYVLLVTSGMAAGASLYISTDAMTAIEKAPVEISLLQWRYIFLTGKKTFLTLYFAGGALGLASACIAYKYSASRATWKLYCAAAMLIFGQAPFTKLVMWQNIDWLMDRANAQVKSLDEIQTRTRLEIWRNQNMVRTLMIVSGFLSTIAAGSLRAV